MKVFLFAHTELTSVRESSSSSWCWVNVMMSETLFSDNNKTVSGDKNEQQSWSRTTASVNTFHTIITRRKRSLSTIWLNKVREAFKPNLLDKISKFLDIYIDWKFFMWRISIGRGRTRNSLKAPPSPLSRVSSSTTASAPATPGTSSPVTLRPGTRSQPHRYWPIRSQWSDQSDQSELSILTKLTNQSLVFWPIRTQYSEFWPIWPIRAQYSSYLTNHIAVLEEEGEERDQWVFQQIIKTLLSTTSSLTELVKR